MGSRVLAGMLCESGVLVNSSVDPANLRLLPSRYRLRIVNQMKIKYIPLLASLLLPVEFAFADDANSAAGAENGFSGKVVETTNVAEYTYVEVDTGSKKLWAATEKFPVNVGDAVTVGRGSPMTDFHSKGLGRTFDVIYFTGSITVNGADAGAAPTLPPGHPAIPGANTPALPPGHPSLTTGTATPNLDVSGIKKADGGNTIEEIFAGKDKLAGTTVTVRGKVVKYNGGILGRNWLHIRDGSGSADKKDNDLTVTSGDPSSLGATVLISGVVATNRDFGAGYKYTVILENAKVTAE